MDNSSLADKRNVVSTESEVHISLILCDETAERNVLRYRYFHIYVT